jgi:hypothetical protein
MAGLDPAMTSPTGLIGGLFGQTPESSPRQLS